MLIIFGRGVPKAIDCSPDELGKGNSGGGSGSLLAEQKAVKGLRPSFSAHVG